MQDGPRGASADPLNGREVRLLLIPGRATDVRLSECPVVRHLTGDMSSDRKRGALDPVGRSAAAAASVCFMVLSADSTVRRVIPRAHPRIKIHARSTSTGPVRPSEMEIEFTSASLKMPSQVNN